MTKTVRVSLEFAGQHSVSLWIFKNKNKTNNIRAVTTFSDKQIGKNARIRMKFNELTRWFRVPFDAVFFSTLLILTSGLYYLRIFHDYQTANNFVSGLTTYEKPTLWMSFIHICIHRTNPRVSFAVLNGTRNIRIALMWAGATWTSIYKTAMNA